MLIKCTVQVSFIVNRHFILLKNRKKREKKTQLNFRKGRKMAPQESIARSKKKKRDAPLTINKR